jgi:hypothetical protein
MAGSELSRTFFPRGQLSEAGGFRYANLYPYIVKLLSVASSGKHSSPPPRYHPQSFNEIWTMREQLAAFNTSIGRSQADQEAYYAFIKTVGSPEQLILDKYFGGKTAPNDKRFAIVPNEYPAAIPEGVSHLLMWYVDRDLPNTWVGNKISEYIEGQKLTTGDFVVYRKPDNSGPFVPGFSKSIILPHVHLLVRDSRLQISSIPQTTNNMSGEDVHPTLNLV